MQVMSAIKKWPKFSGGEKVEILKQLFLAGESMNVDNFVQFFTDDALYQFSNFPIVYGPEGIKGASVDFLNKVEGVHHHIKNMWEVGENEMVVEMEVTYIRHDGKVFTLPCFDSICFKGDKIEKMLIFMDISPVYATPLQETSAIAEAPGLNLADRVRDLFAAAYANDLEKYLTFFTEDAIYRAGSAPPVFGPQGIRKFAIPVMEKFKTVAHDLTEIVEFENTVICQAEVVYNRNDGKVFRIPTANIIRFKGEKIQELQAFGDPSPAFS